MFDSTKTDLKDLLVSIDQGRLQLPDFQRDYVWDDEDVRSLLASIAKGFPVGALLTLESGGEVEFKPRLLTGVQAKEVEPEELLLDGQQRMTSLYQTTFGKEPVRTRTPKKKEVDRYYYIDIKRAVKGEANIEDAILGVPADKILKTNFGKTVQLDLSNRDLEFESDMFPLNLVFDSKTWFYAWRDYWKPKGRDVGDLERDFDLHVLERIQRYKMPIIRLDKENSREAICLVFEKVNVGGKKLDAFELVTAIFAADEFDLREDWNGTHGKKGKPGRKERMVSVNGNPRNVLKKLASTEFLQACTLLHTRDLRRKAEGRGAKGTDLPQISCKREALLALPLAAYREYADEVEKGFIEAAAFLNELKIIASRDIPYPPQVIAVASVFATMGKAAQTVSSKKKLTQWFWSVALGEEYGSSTESKLGRDLPAMIGWIEADGALPRSMDDAIFQQDRLRSLRSRKSAAYKALHALLMVRGGKDFITGKPVELMTFFDQKIDIHHIFPKAWCGKKKIPPKVFNSIINKTPLSKQTNIEIGGRAPSAYLNAIQEKHDISERELDEILRTHLIEPSHLRADDFDAFFEHRLKALSGLVEEAMGKPVVVLEQKNEEEYENEEEANAEDDEGLTEEEAAE